jgi:hypothetical protein
MFFESCDILYFSFSFITYISYIYIQIHSKKSSLIFHQLQQSSCFECLFLFIHGWVYRKGERKKYRNVLSHSAVLFDIYGKVLFVYPDSVCGCILTTWKGQQLVMCWKQGSYFEDIVAVGFILYIRIPSRPYQWVYRSAMNSKRLRHKKERYLYQKTIFTVTNKKERGIGHTLWLWAI